MIASSAKSQLIPSERLLLSRSRGISLIEMLIALLVLSFGLLGMAGLQAYSLRNNTNAYYRSQATALAYDMIDRLRASRRLAVGADPVERPDDPYTSPYNLGLGDSPSGSLDPIVLQDLNEWTSLLRERLPSGVGGIACDDQTAICTVSVQWDDSRGAGGTRPACNATTASGPWVCFVYSTEL